MFDPVDTINLATDKTDVDTTTRFTGRVTPAIDLAPVGKRGWLAAYLFGCGV